MTISKNKIKKMNRYYNPEKYYEHLMRLFIYGTYNQFVSQIEYSMLLDSRNMTVDFINYCKSQDAEIGERIEGHVISIVNSLSDYKEKRHIEKMKLPKLTVVNSGSFISRSI